MVDLRAHEALIGNILERQRKRRKAIDPTHEYPPAPHFEFSPTTLEGKSGEKPSKDRVVNYLPDEETVRNDYTAWYTNSGIPGSDYILGAREDTICEEYAHKSPNGDARLKCRYPALRRLMDLKKALNDAHAHPPLYLQLASSTASDIGAALAPCRFDVILLTPNGSWEETAALPIRSLSADPSFVFLWVGRGDQDGLEKGRECFAKWGFRRAEDIVWVKTTNGRRRAGPGDAERAEDAVAATNAGIGRGGLLASQKEHCLMGIRGTVRRSTDTRFVHCNVDTDVMLWEDSQEADGPRFPPYLYTLIESFCLGTRRLHLNPASSSAASVPPAPTRRGWVTVSPGPCPTDTLPFDPATYPAMLPEKQDGRDVLPYHADIDNLRPKSPTRGGKRGGPMASQRPDSTWSANNRFDSGRTTTSSRHGANTAEGGVRHGNGSGPRSGPRMSGTSTPIGMNGHGRPARQSMGQPGHPFVQYDQRPPLDRQMHPAYGMGHMQDDPQMLYLAAQMQQTQLGAWPYPYGTGGGGYLPYDQAQMQMQMQMQAQYQSQMQDGTVYYGDGNGYYGFEGFEGYGGYHAQGQGQGQYHYQ